MMRSRAVDNEQAGSSAGAPARQHAWVQHGGLRTPEDQYNLENTRGKLRKVYEESFPDRSFVHDYNRYAIQHAETPLTIADSERLFPGAPQDHFFCSSRECANAPGGQGVGIHPEARVVANRLLEEGAIDADDRQAALEMISDIMHFNQRNPGAPVVEDHLEVAANGAGQEALLYQRQEAASEQYAQYYRERDISPHLAPTQVNARERRERPVAASGRMGQFAKGAGKVVAGGVAGGVIGASIAKGQLPWDWGKKKQAKQKLTTTRTTSTTPPPRLRSGE